MIKQVCRIVLFLILSGAYSLAQAETNVIAYTDSDFSIQGSTNDERSGQRVAAGDINGDFFDDLLVCSRFYDPPGRLRAGAIFVMFGGNAPELAGAIRLSESTADLVILGATMEDRIGMSYESSMAPIAIGEINGDEYKDLLVGAPNASRGGLKEVGVVYVFFGRQDLEGVLDLADEVADLTITGATSGAHLGAALSIGDLDGDGIGDLVLGSPLFRREDLSPGIVNPYGRIDVIAGGQYLESIQSWDLSKNPADWVILGSTEQEELGDCMTTGDANGDGIGDLLVGASGAHVERSDSRGKAYLFLGASDRLLGGTTDLILSKPDCTLLGEDRGDRFGHAVGLMQLLSNEEDELVFGTPKAVHETGDPEIDQLLYNQGIVYIIKGQSEFPEEIDLSFQSADVTLYGANSGDLFGYQVVGGAIFSTTSEDLIISAFQAERTGSILEEGLVAIFSGGQIARAAGQWIALATPGDECRIWGGRAGEGLALGLATGDINGDGKSDLFIGAPDSEDRGGRSYLFYSGGVGLSGKKQYLIEDSR